MLMLQSGREHVLVEIDKGGLGDAQLQYSKPRSSRSRWQGDKGEMDRRFLQMHPGKCMRA